MVLINVEKMRMLKSNSSEMKYRLIKQNIERFFRDCIYYYNIYEAKELIIDAGYLPYHYLDYDVLNSIINLLEKELGYKIIIMKISNITKKGYQKGDLINIRLFDIKTADPKDIDDYFNLKMFQPLYSSFHNYYNIDGKLDVDNTYMSCLKCNNFLLNSEEKEDLFKGEIL